MLTTRIGTSTLSLASLIVLVSITFAAVMHDSVTYERPVRTIRGRVTGSGQVIHVVWVDLYDNAEVRLDDSMPFVEQRKRQTRIASVGPKGTGEFNIERLPKGFYEIEFGNRGMGGYNLLSVLVNVDPKGSRDRLCVDSSLEGQSGQSSVAKCPAK
jgi:hypothetical protein